jgi:signal transduction histidine kinase/DNA-binding response OmpR family regulator
MNMRILALEIRLEGDVVLTRQRARQVAGLLGFPPLDQTRIATAASEIARNAFQDAGGGTVEFLVEPEAPPSLVIRVRERGPGIDNLQALLDGPSAAPTGTAIGLLGARRLMDRFEIATATGGGALITMGKSLPKRATALSPRELGRVSAELARHAPQGMLDELQQQNQELIRTLQELRDRQTELNELHVRELQETNRGVVALYAELDDNAKTLKRISDLKSRFLSNMSHEFRSPLNTILSLSGFLLDRSDGELTSEQEKQVAFIRKAADGLSTLVNDLLDLAKVEAGKAVVRPKSFEVATLFEGLRGTIAPLLGHGPVVLVFEEPAGIGTLRTDDSKLGQILRNFLSNAVKYTERGEIRVKVTPGPGDTVIFAVSDTGIGIARENHERIFEEFGQIEGALQGKIKGTGLGLPLSRKLAELLGGSVSVRSQPGVGSTFLAAIPRVLRESAEVADEEAAERPLNPAWLPLLVIEDDPVDLLLYEKIFDGSGFQVLPARTLDAARRVLRRIRPAAVLLDIVLEVESGWTFLTEMKSHEATRNIPILVLTVVEGRERALALGADDFCRKPIEGGWLLNRLATLATRGPVETILIIDDQESDRRQLEQLLSVCGPHRVIEAASGEEGIRRARADCPNVIFLDLGMPDMPGLQVLERLKADDVTREIPVIINTAEVLDEEDRRRIGARSAVILDKSPLAGQDALNTVKEALLKAGLSPDSTPSEAPHG